MPTERAQPPIRASKSHPKTDQEWARIREEFKLLYMTENWKLRDVMDFMKKKRGFIASERQYKSQIEIWGFLKYKKNSKEPHLGADDVTQSDEPSSTASSAIDITDTELYTGGSHIATDEKNTGQQNMNVLLEQRATSRQSFGRHTPSFAGRYPHNSGAANASFNPANWQKGVSHQRQLMPMRLQPPEYPWLIGDHAAGMSHLQPPTVSSNELIGPYGDSEFTCVATRHKTSSSKRLQRPRYNNDCFETVGSVLKTSGHWLDDETPPDSL